MPSNPIQLAALAHALALSDHTERRKAARRELNRLLKSLEPPRARKKPGPSPSFSELDVYEATEKVLDEKTTLPKSMVTYPNGPEWIYWVFYLSDGEVEAHKIPKEWEIKYQRLTPEGWEEALKKRKEWNEFGWEDLYREVTERLPRKKNGESYSNAAVRPFVRDYMYAFIQGWDFPPRFRNGRQPWMPRNEKKSAMQAFYQHKMEFRYPDVIRRFGTPPYGMSPTEHLRLMRLEET